MVSVCGLGIWCEWCALYYVWASTLIKGSLVLVIFYPFKCLTSNNQLEFFIHFPLFAPAILCNCIQPCMFSAAHVSTVIFLATLSTSWRYLLRTSAWHTRIFSHSALRKHNYSNEDITGLCELVRVTIKIDISILHLCYLMWTWRVTAL